MTTEVTSETFPSLVLERSQTIPVLVDFWADWCAPCKMLMPLLTNIASEFSENVSLVKVNTDQESQLASTFNVRSLPTVKLFKKGEVIDEFMGALPESAIREFIEKHLDRPADDQIRIASELSANGQHEKAIETLTAALTEDPSYDKLILALGTEQVIGGHLADARKTLDSLPSRLRFDPPVKALFARLELAEMAGKDTDKTSLEKYLSEHPDDLGKRAQLGAVYFSTGDHGAAMEQWLQMVTRGNSDSRDIGRENLIRTFEILGSNNEQVSEYRKRLAQALN